MFRFPNPGSDIKRFIQVFKDVFSNNKNAVYSIDYISYIMAITNSASAVGSVGIKAFKNSKKKDKSRDSIYNQAKAYVEAYRWLGWLYGDSLKTFILTPIGKMILDNDYEADPIFTTCFVCWNTPNENIKSKSDYDGYPILNVLYTASLIGNKISRDEMILGPLNEKYQMMGSSASYIKDIRDGNLDLNQELKKSPISENTQKNYTRLVLAGLKYTGLMQPLKGKDKKYLCLSQNGIDVISHIEHGLLTIRDKDEKSKLKASFLWFLKNCKFRIDSFEDIKEVIGSPYQVFSPSDLDDIFVDSGLLPKHLKTRNGDNLDSIVDLADLDSINTRAENIFTNVKSTILDRNSRSSCRQNSKTEILISNNSTKEILKIISNYKKEQFYPFIADLFNIIGFDSVVSPNGQNAQRADVVLYYNKRTIPVEVKSKTEVGKLNIKAIEQAVENKIILESRKYAPSLRDDSTLAVGFDYPDSMRENDLINACDKVYGIKVLMISAKDLIEMAKSVLIDNKVWDIETIITGKGKMRIE